MNYGTLLSQVAVRLGNRQDLLSPVAPATTAIIPLFVEDRISYFQRALYAPSEQLDYSIVCVKGQHTYNWNSYPALVGMQSIRNVYVLQGNCWIPLWRVNWFSDLLSIDVLDPPNQSLPWYWATYGQTLRVWPAPNRAYPLRLECCLAPPMPQAPDEVNWWTIQSEGTGAASLIINATCAEICAMYLNDPDRAQRYGIAADREARSLRAYTARLAGPSVIRSW